jgi:nucleoside-diphosphate-sugar epimerase
MASQAPVMNTDRARTLLGWEPSRSSVEAMREVIDGLAGGAGVHASPSLRPGR